MFRILGKLCFWVLIARWGYAELQLILPSATPAIDYALENVQIPTHDKWNAESLDQFLLAVRTRTEDSLARLEKQLSATDRKDQLASVVTPELKRVQRVLEEQNFSRF
jgi:hypothetical protein